MTTLKKHTIFYQKIIFDKNTYWFAQAYDKIVYIGFERDEIFKIFQEKSYILKETISLNDKLVKDNLIEYFNNPNYTCNLEDFLLFGTEFQKTIWKFLITIKFGSILTYSEVAQALGKPNAVRAIANAIAKNPILILIPCHRVVGKTKLLKYRAGANLKEKLLNYEKSI